jgi:hypothetical protein
MEIGDAELDALVEQRLLEAEIVADAGFRLQVRVGVEAVRRVAVIKFVERRRLEPGAEAGFEFGAGFGNEKGRSNPIGGLAAELAIGVVTNADRVEEPLSEARLELDKAGVVGDVRLNRGAVVDLIELMFRAERQDLAGQAGEPRLL